MAAPGGGLDEQLLLARDVFRKLGAAESRLRRSLRNRPTSSGARRPPPAEPQPLCAQLTVSHKPAGAGASAFNSPPGTPPRTAARAPLDEEVTPGGGGGGAAPSTSPSPGGAASPPQNLQDVAAQTGWRCYTNDRRDLLVTVPPYDMTLGTTATGTALELSPPGPPGSVHGRTPPMERDSLLSLAESPLCAPMPVAMPVPRAASSPAAHRTPHRAAADGIARALRGDFTESPSPSPHTRHQAAAPPAAVASEPCDVTESAEGAAPLRRLFAEGGPQGSPVRRSPASAGGLSAWHQGEVPTPSIAGRAAMDSTLPPSPAAGKRRGDVVLVLGVEVAPDVERSLTYHDGEDADDVAATFLEHHGLPVGLAPALAGRLRAALLEGQADAAPRDPSPPARRHPPRRSSSAARRGRAAEAAHLARVRKVQGDRSPSQHKHPNRSPLSHLQPNVRRSPSAGAKPAAAAPEARAPPPRRAASLSAVAAGSRLHAQGMELKRAAAARAEEHRMQQERRELQGSSFAPEISPTARTIPRRKAGYQSQRLAPRVPTLEEAEYRSHCTFTPKLSARTEGIVQRLRVSGAPDVAFESLYEDAEQRRMRSLRMAVTPSPAV